MWPLGDSRTSCSVSCGVSYPGDALYELMIDIDIDIDIITVIENIWGDFFMTICVQLLRGIHVL